MDTETIYLAAIIALLMGLALSWGLDLGCRRAAKWWRNRQLRILNSQINDCKPGCFKTNPRQFSDGVGWVEEDHE